MLPGQQDDGAPHPGPESPRSGVTVGDAAVGDGHPPHHSFDAASARAASE